MFEGHYWSDEQLCKCICVCVITFLNIWKHLSPLNFLWVLNMLQSFWISVFSHLCYLSYHFEFVVACFCCRSFPSLMICVWFFLQYLSMCVTLSPFFVCLPSRLCSCLFPCALFVIPSLNLELNLRCYTICLWLLTVCGTNITYAEKVYCQAASILLKGSTQVILLNCFTHDLCHSSSSNACDNFYLGENLCGSEPT